MVYIAAPPPPRRRLPGAGLAGIDGPACTLAPEWGAGQGATASLVEGGGAAEHETLGAPVCVQAEAGAMYTAKG